MGKNRKNQNWKKHRNRAKRHAQEKQARQNIAERSGQQITQEQENEGWLTQDQSLLATPPSATLSDSFLSSSSSSSIASSYFSSSAALFTSSSAIQSADAKSDSDDDPNPINPEDFLLISSDDEAPTLHSLSSSTSRLSPSGSSPIPDKSASEPKDEPSEPGEHYTPDTDRGSSPVI